MKEAKNGLALQQMLVPAIRIVDRDRIIHGFGNIQITVGVKTADETLALMVQIALDLKIDGKVVTHSDLWRAVFGQTWPAWLVR